MKAPLHVVLAALAFAVGTLPLDAYTGSWPPATNLSDTKSAVPIYATVSLSPPSITLNFPRAGKYQIFRKDPSATAWGTALITQTVASTSWTDNAVNVGQFYEYKAIVTDGAVQF